MNYSKGFEMGNQKIQLILMRHGQSLWNKKNLFTGWVDVPLSTKGIEEALEGGERIKHLPIDAVYTSSLCRAQVTAFLALSRHDEQKTPVIHHPEGEKLEEWGKIYSEKTAESTIPVYCHWELNERMYGELQGLNKDETRAKFGVDQVKVWRRSFDTPPPNGESLKETAARAIPFFEKAILPRIKKGECVFIAAHGNSLRAITMYLKNLSPEEVVKLEIPTGEPICYTYSENQWEEQKRP